MLAERKASLSDFRRVLNSLVQDFRGISRSQVGDSREIIGHMYGIKKEGF